MKQPSTASKWLKRGTAAALVLLLVAQAIPYGRDHARPASSSEPAWDSPRTRELFMRACGDCHSNETQWVWYTNIAPVSWLVQHDVDEAREHFNVSAWDEGPGHSDEAAEEFEEGEMPLWFYLPLHPEARLSADDRSALLAGLRATFGEEGHEGEDDD